MSKRTVEIAVPDRVLQPTDSEVLKRRLRESRDFCFFRPFSVELGKVTPRVRAGFPEWDVSGRVRICPVEETPDCLFFLRRFDENGFRNLWHKPHQGPLSYVPRWVEDTIPDLFRVGVRHANFRVVEVHE